MNRRDAVRTLAGACIAGALPRFAFGQPVAQLTVTDLDHDLFVIAGAGANVVAAKSSAGILLVDGGLRAHSKALLDRVAQRWPGAHVEILFNTNWRDEHVGSNEALGRAGAKIMAHENTKLWLGGDFDVEWEDRHYSPQPQIALPNATFYSSGELQFGDRKIQYWYLPRAHTDGDVAVFFPDANLLAASDLLSVGRYPVLDYSTGGWIGGLEAASKSLLGSTDASTRIVPARGAVAARADLESQLAMCSAVRAAVADAFRHGQSLEEFAAAKPTRDFDGRWGDPDTFLPLVYKGAWAHVRELGGII